MFHHPYLQRRSQKERLMTTLVPISDEFPEQRVCQKSKQLSKEYSTNDTEQNMMVSTIQNSSKLD